VNGTPAFYINGKSFSGAMPIEQFQAAINNALLALGKPAVPVSSPKSMVGHLIAAAGSLSAMVCLLAMRDDTVPPTINLERADPDCDLDYVPGRARRVRVRTALVNAFGFGGQNCVVVLRAPNP